MSDEDFLSDEEVEYLLSGGSEEYSQEYEAKKAAAAVKKQRYDHFYMDMALRCAGMSYGIRAKVGAVIVKNDNIISMGWNGMPAGMPNDCEDRVYSTKVEIGRAHV
jgi:deoxycytidylate deaminase